MPFYDISTGSPLLTVNFRMASLAVADANPLNTFVTYPEKPHFATTFLWSQASQRFSSKKKINISNMFLKLFVFLCWLGFIKAFTSVYTVLHKLK